MELSPFEPKTADGGWLKDAELFLISDLWRQTPPGSCAYQIYPARPDEDLNRYRTGEIQRIPYNEDEYEPDEIGFNINEANSGLEYVRLCKYRDRPTIEWYTIDQYKDRFHTDPLNHGPPQGVDPDWWNDYLEDRVRERLESHLKINIDRKEFLRRIAKLWNGDVVRGVHLLANECPSVRQFTNDLDEDELKEFYYKASLGREFFLAFGNTDWHEPRDPFFSPTHIFRKKIWYDPEHKARLLINKKSEYPDLKGDPFEGITHRVTVGLACLKCDINGWGYDSYHQMGRYNLDVYSEDSNFVCEIITEHNNWDLYRDTIKKIQILKENGIPTIAIFDSRDTAYSVFNFWHRDGLVELPNGPFESNYSIKNGRSQTDKAFQDERYEWPLPRWTTTWKLKQEILGKQGPDLSRKDITSVEW